MKKQSKLVDLEANENSGEMFLEPVPRPVRRIPELLWGGKRPFTSIQYSPAQLKESYGNAIDEWMNRLYWGDNLQVLSHLLKEYRAKVDLIYIDPPFDSKADYKKNISLKNSEFSSGLPGLAVKQFGDMWTEDEYLQFIYDRLFLLRELLSSSGILYLHCDPRRSPHIRIIMDEIFGKERFVNEIIWHYTGGGRSENYFSRKHDAILSYSKTGNFVFNGDSVRIPYKETSAYAKGGIVSKTGKLYKPNPLGTLPDDVWDLPIINPLSGERLGYPTQKPEALLERIIRASSNPGSLVLDCFMGSGTTQAVAMKLGRRFIGADINMGAIQTAIKRLVNIIKEKKKEEQTHLDGYPLYINFEVYDVNNHDIFRNPVEAKDLIIQALEIEKLGNADIFDGMKDGYKVKIMPVNRVATRMDLNPLTSGMNYRELDEIIDKNPNAAADRIMLVCMGHEPDLAARLKMEIGPQYNIEVEVVDILREKERGLTFKYDAEADIAIEGDELVIKSFYPRNLLQKLRLPYENVKDWRELVESVSIDWNYNGEVFRPLDPDIPGKKELVKGRYRLPPAYGDIRVKITDLLSESFEMTIGEEQW